MKEMKPHSPKGVEKDWRGNVIPNYVVPILKNLGYTPTVRGMFYILLGKPYYLISKGDYANMGKALTRARRNGMISKTAFADNSRRIIKNFDDEYETLAEFVQRHIDYVKNPLDYYKIPRWHNQPNYVEVWIDCRKEQYQCTETVVSSVCKHLYFFMSIGTILSHSLMLSEKLGNLFLIQ